MILGIGTDLVDERRIQRSIERFGDRFLDRIFTDAERADPPPVGSWITYRYNGETATGLPRFARFLRRRPGGPPPEPSTRR